MLFEGAKCPWGRTSSKYDAAQTNISTNLGTMTLLQERMRLETGLLRPEEPFVFQMNCLDVDRKEYLQTFSFVNFHSLMSHMLGIEINAKTTGHYDNWVPQIFADIHDFKPVGKFWSDVFEGVDTEKHGHAMVFIPKSSKRPTIPYNMFFDNCQEDPSAMHLFSSLISCNKNCLICYPEAVTTLDEQIVDIESEFDVVSDEEQKAEMQKMGGEDK